MPNEAVATLFPKDLGDHDYFYWMDQLASVPADSVLYDVYAFDKPTELGGEEVMIGQVQLDGQLISSKWSDQNLFFRHPKMDPDLEDHPEWIPYVPHFDSGCPFTH